MDKAFQIGQGDLGLSDRSYYINETRNTIAYRQLWKNIAFELTNDTSMIDKDVNDTFDFEKTIAQVWYMRCENFLEDFRIS